VQRRGLVQLARRARLIGLSLAALTRIALLFSIVWLTRLTRPWFALLGQQISGRDLILAGGGLFLLVKSVLEIHHTLEGAAAERKTRVMARLAAIVVQIAVIDIVMMWLSRPISEFVDRHPTVKMLALSFLILVGMALIAEGMDFHIPKGYLHFAMAFSVLVEMINIRLRKLLDARRDAARH